MFVNILGQKRVVKELTPYIFVMASFTQFTLPASGPRYLTFKHFSAL